MNRVLFSWIALGIGAVVVLVLLGSGAPGAQGQPGLPLLTSLFLAEFGFVVTAAGCFLSLRDWWVRQPGVLYLVLPLACGVLALGLAWLGLAIWESRVAM